jgi:hypothetical protein
LAVEHPQFFLDEFPVKIGQFQFLMIFTTRGVQMRTALENPQTWIFVKTEQLSVSAFLSLVSAAFHVSVNNFDGIR